MLSGDTRLSENLIRRAEGVDLLIHEVVALATHLRAGDPAGRAATIIRRITRRPSRPASSSPASSRGSRCTRTSAARSATEQDVIAPTRKAYAGPLELGEDLMVIEIGETVVVRRPAATAR